MACTHGQIDSVERRRTAFIRQMRAHFSQMLLVGSLHRKRWQIVEAEESGVHGLVAGTGLAAGDFTEKDDLVSVEELQRTVAAVGVKDSQYLARYDLEAALLQDLARHHLRWDVPNVSPAARHGPA